MKTADELYYEVASRGVDKYTNDELVSICQAILDTPGDQTLAICYAKRDGWWKDPQHSLNH